jgi:hypothetical protein
LFSFFLAPKTETKDSRNEVEEEVGPDTEQNDVTAPEVESHAGEIASTNEQEQRKDGEPNGWRKIETRGGEKNA